MPLNKHMFKLLNFPYQITEQCYIPPYLLFSLNNCISLTASPNRPPVSMETKTKENEVNAT